MTKWSLSDDTVTITRAEYERLKAAEAKCEEALKQFEQERQKQMAVKPYNGMCQS